jgi:hypothetical protein
MISQYNSIVILTITKYLRFLNIIAEYFININSI